jgi:hypothetical protein
MVTSFRNNRRSLRVAILALFGSACDPEWHVSATVEVSPGAALSAACVDNAVASLDGVLKVGARSIPRTAKFSILKGSFTVPEQHIFVYELDAQQFSVKVQMGSPNTVTIEAGGLGEGLVQEMRRVRSGRTRMFETIADSCGGFPSHPKVTETCGRADCDWK